MPRECEPALRAALAREDYCRHTQRFFTPVRNFPFRASAPRDHDVTMFARACSLAFAATVLLGATAASAGEWCTALDGYTLRCSGGERVKVEGIRAPELNQPGGEEARQRLQKRIRSGELVVQRGGTDKYGRTLARVYVNGDRITDIDLNPKPSKKR
jgi:endonuclease YncB( thermonuclease family)